MKVELTEHECKVTRENDSKIYNESRLLHKVKVELIRQGYDVIKKLMWKDGHLVADTQHYIRERKGNFAIWHSDYALRFNYEDYNTGELFLMVEGDIPKLK